MSKYKKSFNRLFPGNIGICEICFGPKYHSTNAKCLSCRQKPDDPIMVEEIV